MELVALTFAMAGAGLFLPGDPILVCQVAHALGIGHPFLLLEEGDGVAAFAAAEALEKSLRAIDYEAGRTLAVEWAAAPVGFSASPLLERYEGANDLLDHGVCFDAG